MKAIIWKGDTLTTIKEFPAAVRREVGYQLSNVQFGLPPSDWKPMLSIGKGVREIRIHYRGQYRVIYTASFKEGIYVFHAFQKKAQKTPKSDLELAKKRYKELLCGRQDG